MQTTVSSDEKLMAALGYWCSIVLWLIPALIIYLVKKDQSSFIKKHALQAILLNVAAFAVIGIGLSIVSGVIGSITLGLGSLLVMLVQVCAYLAAMVYVVILGVKTFQGEDPDIPMLTDMLRNHLS